MKEKTDVYISGSSFTEDEVKNKTVIVIDVLRAGSSILTALNNGAKGIIPVSDMAEASEMAQNLDSASYLLCGEKNGIKIDGYHLGNSPFEYEEKTVKAKTLILKTTNGTKAIDRCSGAERVLIGSFLNLSKVVEEVSNDDNEMVIICSGWRQRLSLEDMLCAGAILHRLNGKKIPADAPDGAKVAYSLYEKYASSILPTVRRSNHAARLVSLGFEKDIDYCCEIDRIPIIPELKDGMLKI